MTSDKGVVERLRPSAVVDETVGMAVRALRAEGLAMLAGSLNEWLVENNSLKSDAQTRIETLERALRPFAEHDAGAVAAVGVFSIPDEHPLLGTGLGNDWRPSITVGDFRRARAALSPSTNGTEK